MNKVNNNTAFFAFGKVNESVEAGPIKRYIGVGTVKVLSINPNKSELEKIYGTTLDKEPEYLGTTQVGPEGNRKEVKQIRIDVIVSAEPEKNEGVDMISKVSFYVADAYRMNGNMDKVQIIDKYGRTAWVTIEEAKAKAIPMYANGPANIDQDYRPAYVGEAELTEFIKKYLNISEPMKYVDGKWIDADNKEDALCRLDNIANYFSNNIAELKEIATMQPNNVVKVLFGIKTNNENKQFQTAFTGMFLKSNAKDFTKLSKEIEGRSFNNVEYEVCPLKEYVVKATSFDADPLSTPAPAVNGWF